MPTREEAIEWLAGRRSDDLPSPEHEKAQRDKAEGKAFVAKDTAFVCPGCQRVYVLDTKRVYRRRIRCSACRDVISMREITFVRITRRDALRARSPINVSDLLDGVEDIADTNYYAYQEIRKATGRGRDETIIDNTKSVFEGVLALLLVGGFWLLVLGAAYMVLTAVCDMSRPDYTGETRHRPAMD